MFFQFGIEISYIGSLDNHHSRICPQLPRQLPVTHIDAIYLPRPSLQQTISKPPCRRADVHNNFVFNFDSEEGQRSIEFKSSPAGKKLIGFLEYYISGLTDQGTGFG